MLIKKLGAIAATGALLLAVAAPAFADDNVIVVHNADTNVSVYSGTIANSGVNGISAHDEAGVTDSSIHTGAAVASNTIGTEVNYTTVTSVATDDAPKIIVANCDTHVTVAQLSIANSGVNGISASEDGSVEGSNITTGAASTGSNIQSLVNVTQVTVSGK